MANNTRGSRLVCFYCGKRTALKYDGRMREFSCSFCDATNHLDEHGDITDPPVAKTTREPVRHTQFAIPRASSPVPEDPSFSLSFSSTTPPSTAVDIFCARCLKNQSLFTACLAQYESDSDSEGKGTTPVPVSTAAKKPPKQPRDPAKSQRRYYAFRRNLERLYPQMCAECEPRVLERVRQAGYTAKTDHLRRMTERSRAMRAAAGTARWSALNWADTAGRACWCVGLALQLAWHVSCSARAVENESFEDPRWNRAAWWAYWVGVALPPDMLGRAALWAAMLGCWWNPEWVKVFKGFSKHILHLPQWYALQAVTIAVRAMAWKMLGNVETDVETLGGEAPRLTGVAVISGHVFIAFFSSLVFIIANRAVTIDTTPLFGKDIKPLPMAPTSDAAAATSSRRANPPRRNQTQTLSDVLDEVLATPPRRRGTTTTHQPPNGVAPPMAAPELKYRGDESPSVRLGGLSLSPPAPPTPRPQTRSQSRLQQTPLRTPARTPNHHPSTPQQRHRPPYATDGEEMDWSPIPAPARALNTSSSLQQQRPFGAAPTQANHSTFWYKVPPAPTAPLHKALNPPTAPRIIEQPPEAPNPFLRAHPVGNTPHHQPNPADDNGVTFSEPSFFAPERSNDPANKLAEMLGSSWSLGVASDDNDDGETTEENSDLDATVAAATTAHLKKRAPRRRQRVEANAAVVVRDLLGQVIPTRRHACVAQVVVLFLVALAWAHATDTREPLMMGACVLAAALISTWDLSVGMWRLTSTPTSVSTSPSSAQPSTADEAANSQPKQSTRRLLVAAFAAELAVEIHVGTQVRHGDERCAPWGVWLFAGMVGVRVFEAVVGGE